MSQTIKSSYKKLFSLLEESDDVFELLIIGEIQNEYTRNHKNNFKEFEKLLAVEKEIFCPKCKSNKIIGHGKDRNDTQRYKCKDCMHTFNIAANSLFFSSKINIQAWFIFLECLLSGTSTLVACTTAKISTTTGSQWMKKIFQTLNTYQDSIVLDKEIYIDETYVHEDKSKIFYFDDIGKIRKVKKQPRGISRNKICILIATDGKQSFAEVVCNGRPQRVRNFAICKKHITKYSHLIGDEDNSLTYTAKELGLERTTYKANTELAYEKLVPIDQLCNRFKFFINKHRGFKKELLQDYINLFIFIDNAKNSDYDLYKITMKLLKQLFNSKKYEL